MDLINGKAGIFALIGCVKGKDNIFFGDTEFNQFIGNANFCPIVLNPDFAIFDV